MNDLGVKHRISLARNFVNPTYQLMPAIGKVLCCIAQLRNILRRDRRNHRHLEKVQNGIRYGPSIYKLFDERLRHSSVQRYGRKCVTARMVIIEACSDSHVLVLVIRNFQCICKTANWIGVVVKYHDEAAKFIYTRLSLSHLLLPSLGSRHQESNDNSHEGADRLCPAGQIRMSFCPCPERRVRGGPESYR